MQLQTGYIPLNKHLHRIGWAKSPYCQLCPCTEEDVNHSLFNCYKYMCQRLGLIISLRQRAFTTQGLLSNKNAICNTLNFVNTTGQLSHMYGDISIELDREDIIQS
jgi:hypothetical protein